MKNGTQGKMLLLIAAFALSVLWPLFPSEGALKLAITLNRANINFLDADPDLVPSVPAMENPLTIDIRATGNPHGTWRLTVLASGDLVSGADVIPVSNVSWTARPLPLIDGRMDKSTPQTVASGLGNINMSGTIQFYFKNSWNYRVGNYSQVVIYTLSAP